MQGIKQSRATSLRPLVALTVATLALAARAEAAAPVCTANDVCAPAANPCTISGTRDVASGCHLDFGTRSVVLTGALQAATPGGSYTVSAGTLSLTAGKIRSTGPTGFAGGNVTVNVAGALVMSGSGPTLDVGGAAGGGNLVVNAGSIDVRTGTVESDGTGSEACGGAITLRATSGPLLIATPVHATGHILCAGGQLDLSGSRVEIASTLNVSGGDYPGGITVTANTGDITLTSAGALRANGEQIELGDGGDGGPIALIAESGNVAIQGTITTEGASPEGEAGSIVILSGGTLAVNALLSAQGNGGGSNGGTIEIDALGDVTFGANVRVNGGSDAAAGEIDVRSDGVVSLVAGKALQANGGSFGGGAVTVRDASNISIAGAIEARGTGGNGGFATLESCRSTVTGTLDTGASGGGLSGANAITAGLITVPSAGRLLATPCNPLVGASCNQLTLVAGVPAIDPLAVVTPAATLQLDPQFNICCGNASIEPGETCDDGNGLSCDGCSYQCQTETNPPCPSDGNECTADCSPQTGCTYKPRTGEACTADADLCTADTCNAKGVCAHPPRVCNDGVACTVDSCNPSVGCVAAPDDARCDDHESCTADACSASAGCTHQPAADGAACSDGDACTTEDACAGGICTPQGPDLRCDDGNACTTDSCLAPVGCQFAEDPAACPCTSGAGALPSGTACADGNDCSPDDQCDGSGQCVGGAVCPDDGTACTADLCIPLGGNKEICLAVDNQCVASCAGQPDGTACSDGSACTGGACQGGVCVTTTAACGDGDACTGADYCVDVLGCRSGAPPLDDPMCEAPPGELDVFTCYGSKASRGAPRLVPVFDLPAADRFGSARADVRKHEGLCLPSNVNGADPTAPAHPDKLAAYVVRLHDVVPTGLPTTDLAVTNALGTIRLDVKKLDGAMIPSALSTSTPPGAPVPPDPDRFACYKVSVTPGSEKFMPRYDVAVEDQLGALTVDVIRPSRLCTPLDLGTSGDASSHALQLLCYQARTSPGTPRFAKRSGVLLGSALGSETVDVVKLAEVCVPSTLAAP